MFINENETSRTSIRAMRIAASVIVSGYGYENSDAPLFTYISIILIKNDEPVPIMLG